MSQGAAIFGPRTHVNMTQDISLVGYDQRANYEQVNMSNYMIHSLMDKGPEEVIMPNEEFNPEERKAMSRNRIQVRYNPREPIKKQNIDLNDYSLDFFPGQGPDLISAMAVDESRRRVKEYQYFNNDAAKQVPIGRVAPTKQNDMIYGSRLDSLRLRQDFVNEVELQDPSKMFIGISKKGLNFDPHRSCSSEKAMVEYEKEVLATTKTQYQQKVRQMAAVFNSMRSLEFDKDSMAMILRKAACKDKRGPAVSGNEKIDHDLGDSNEEVIKNSFTKIKQNRDMSKNGKMTSNDQTFGDDMEMVTRVSNTVNQKAQENSRKERYSSGQMSEGFEDVIIDPLRKTYVGKDKMDKFKRYANDNPEVEDVMEESVKRLREDSAILSKYYYINQSRDNLEVGDDNLVTGSVRRRNKNEKKQGNRAHDSDSLEMEDNGEETVRKPLMKYDTQKIKRAVSREKEYQDEEEYNVLQHISASVQRGRRNDRDTVHMMADMDSFARTNSRGFHKTVNRDMGNFESVMSR